MPTKLLFEDDQWCYGCGQDNKKGLKLVFEHSQKDRLTSQVTFSKEHQGFKGIVHGGMLAVALDDLMVNLAWRENYHAVTAELTLRIKKPALVGEVLSLSARIIKKDSKIVYLESEAVNAKGEAVATAKASCMILKENKQS